MSWSKLLVACLISWSAEASSSILIGYVGGLSGQDVDQAALFSYEAMRSYFEEVNSKGGIKGRKVEIIPLDNKGLPQENHAVFQEAKRRQVTLLTGVHFSNDALVLNDLAEANQIPLVVVTASHPDVVANRRYVARSCFNDVTQAAELSRLAFQKLKAKRISIVTDVRNRFSTYIAEAFKKSAQKAGVKLVKEVNVSKGEVSQNLAQAADELANAGSTDLILFTTQARESTLLLSELSKRRVKSNFLGTDAWESANILKMLESLDQKYPIYFAGHWVPDLGNSDWKKLASAIQSKFKTALSPYLCDPVISFDTARLIEQSLKNCADLKPQSIMRCLKSTEVLGLTGPLKISEDGESHRPVYLFRGQGTKVEPIVF